MVNALFSLSLLASCGGSAAPEAAASAALNFNVASTPFLDQVEKLKKASATSAMPTSGTGNYVGYLGLSRSSNFSEPDAVGVASLTANFSTSSVSGAASGFITADGSYRSDSITFFNGLIVGNQVAADIFGTNPLAAPGSSVSGSFQGEFLGPQASAVAGTIVGTSGSGSVYGRLAGESQR
ncbi:MAG: hypothetical protein CFE32_14880 [Alphaproteobacteria bacterium PA3]|nr:MAG: hypothetical protein CFE32_14880 [Alphaproteobacteria bacterium PA3]